MELKQAEKYANGQLVAHGLAKLGWKFKWDKRATKRFGQCRFYHKEIGVSAQLAELNDAVEVQDTILHEIAHALAKVRGHDDARHSHVWKAICVEIGAKPMQYYSNKIALPRGRWSGVCPKCNQVFERTRKAKNAMFHRPCNIRGQYKFAIVWSENKI